MISIIMISIIVSSWSCHANDYFYFTKLNDIATLFTHDEKTRYYFILKLFPFLVKGDAKAWYSNFAPGCVRSPHDMIYYFPENYFPAHMKQAALQEIFNFV